MKNLNRLKFVTATHIFFGSTFIFADQVTMKVSNLVSYVTSLALVAVVGFFVFELLASLAYQNGFQRVKWVAFSALLMGIAKYLLPALIQAVS